MGAARTKFNFYYLFDGRSALDRSQLLLLIYL